MGQDALYGVLHVMYDDGHVGIRKHWERLVG